MQRFGLVRDTYGLAVYLSDSVVLGIDNNKVTSEVSMYKMLFYKIYIKGFASLHCDQSLSLWFVETSAGSAFGGNACW